MADPNHFNPGLDLFGRTSKTQDNRSCGNLFLFLKISFANTADVGCTSSFFYTVLIDVDHNATNNDSLRFFTDGIL